MNATKLNQKINQLNNRLNNLQRKDNTRKRSRNTSAPVANGATLSSKRQSQANKYHVRQTETFGKIQANGTSSYSVSSVSINPGVSFPWLANIAKSYDKYKLNMLRFRFKTAVPTLTAGSIGLGFDYNPLDGSPLESESFSQLTTWNIQSVWKNFTVTVDVTKKLLPWMFVRTRLIGGSDLKTYDIGKLHIMFEGIPTTVASGDLLGYIEVDYDIDFVDKQPLVVYDNITQGLSSVATRRTRLAANLSNGSWANNYYFICSLLPQLWDRANNLDLSVTSTYAQNLLQGSIDSTIVAPTNTGGTLVLPNGIYNVSIKLGSKFNATGVIGGLYDTTNSEYLLYANANGIQGTIVVDNPVELCLVFQNTSGSAITMTGGSNLYDRPGYEVNNITFNMI